MQQLHFDFIWNRSLSPEGEARKGRVAEHQVSVASEAIDPLNRVTMEEVVRKENLLIALKRVQANKGSSGIDGMSVEELRDHLKHHWPQIRDQLLDGGYRPQPVQRVSIPKPGGGTRDLGIPTVLDRFIQQALHQVLSPLYDETFSASSYGFRSGRNAHQAVRQAKRYIEQGYGYVVDLDLEKYFDRINHDILMGRLARRITDKRILKLIRLYLQAGVMVHGVVIRRHEGAPQGGPLSPLLSNILLDELGKELNVYLTGWIGYYRLIETPTTLRDLDSWIRRRLRCFVMKKWINNCHTRFRNLCRMGVSAKNAAPVAGSRKGPWVMSNFKPVKVAMPNRFFVSKGLLFLNGRHTRLIKAT